MKSIMYVTDPKWAEFLSFHNYTDGINFWRIDKRKLKPPLNAYFYFLLSGSRKIAGRGRFRKMHLLSIEDAWDNYGERNGVASFEDFQKSLERVFEHYHPSSAKMINNIILDDVEWLSLDRQFKVGYEIFPRNIPSVKYFDDDEIGPIAAKFYSNTKVSNPVKDNEPKQLTVEGRKKLVTHLKAERNRSIVKAKKAQNAWVCDICQMKFSEHYGVAYIEAHHKIPLSKVKAQIVVEQADLVLLCPNCHAAIHKYMAKFPTLDYQELKQKILRILMV